MQDQFPEIQRSLGRVEGKLDLLTNRVDRIIDKTIEQDKVIASLQKRVYGMSLLISTAVSFIGPYFLTWFKGNH